MTAWSNISPTIRSQEKRYFSSTKEMVQDHVVRNDFRIILKVELKRLKLEYITKRKNINLTVSLMNFQSADFYINHIRPFI